MLVKVLRSRARRRALHQRVLRQREAREVDAIARVVYTMNPTCGSTYLQLTPVLAFYRVCPLCPHCYGDGSVSGGNASWDNPYGDPPEACPLCDGYGVVLAPDRQAKPRRLRKGLK